MMVAGVLFGAAGGWVAATLGGTAGGLGYIVGMAAGMALATYAAYRGGP